MSYLVPASAPLQNIFWSREHSLLRQSALILTGVFLLAIASQIIIPLLPVPLTLQSATVILIGMAYGPRHSTYVVACYLLLGCLGMPVFADHSSGIACLSGPTAGYLIGFLPAAWVSGYLAQRGFAKTISGSFIAALIGASIIFAFGVPVLALSVGWHQAIAFGLMPFIISEPIKLFALSTLTPNLWKQSNS